MPRVSEAEWLFASELCGPIEAAGVERHDVDAVPIAAHEILQVGPEHRLLGEAVDEQQCLDQPERRADPHGICGHRIQADRSSRRRHVPSHQHKT